MLTVTREFTFEAAHYLPDYQGKCNRTHGHSYKLQVTVSDSYRAYVPKSTYSTMVMDFGDLKEIVNRRIIQRLDHTLLNRVKGLEIPTAETMVKWIISELMEELNGNLFKVRLYETSNSYAEWRRYC